MELQRFIDQALEEDIGNGDHTTLSTIPSDHQGKAHLLVKDEGVIAGVDLAFKVLDTVDGSLRVTPRIKDGQRVSNGDIAFVVEGNARSLLTAERVMLNFMQRMSGIATLTASYLDKVSDLGTRILDTRKTTPGLRSIEKWAVRIGGGTNHRIGLYDMILIKDNHIDHAGGIEKAIEAADSYRKKKDHPLEIEIEARDLDEVDRILQRIDMVDRILLDNFDHADLRTAVDRVNGRAVTEASGGITLETVRSFAECGVDSISVGAITHSAPAFDLSFKAECP